MPSDLLQQTKLLAKTYNLTPVKSKGQNFLVDSTVLGKIVQAAAVQPDDVVLEVGPGLGILTEELVKKAKKVISVELDRKLFDFLKTKFITAQNLELVNQDILDFIPEDYNLQANAYKLAANLPYNVTSVFLKKFLTARTKPTEMTLLLQKEVAQRMCAKPGSMSLLALSVQLYSSPQIIEMVNSGSFWPAPDVDSAIIKLSSVKAKKDVDKTLDGLSEDKFWRIARIGFAGKRKQLHNNLSAGLHIASDEAKKMLKNAEIDPKMRAQNLSISQWVQLAKQV